MANKFKSYQGKHWLIKMATCLKDFLGTKQKVKNLLNWALNVALVLWTCFCNIILDSFIMKLSNHKLVPHWNDIWRGVTGRIVKTAKHVYT